MSKSERSTKPTPKRKPRSPAPSIRMQDRIAKLCTMVQDAGTINVPPVSGWPFLLTELGVSGTAPGDTLVLHAKLECQAVPAVRGVPKIVRTKIGDVTGKIAKRLRDSKVCTEKVMEETAKEIRQACAMAIGARFTGEAKAYLAGPYTDGQAPVKVATPLPPGGRLLGATARALIQEADMADEQRDADAATRRRLTLNAHTLVTRTELVESWTAELPGGGTIVFSVPSPPGVIMGEGPTDVGLRIVIGLDIHKRTDEGALHTISLSMTRIETLARTFPAGELERLVKATRALIVEEAEKYAAQVVMVDRKEAEAAKVDGRWADLVTQTALGRFTLRPVMWSTSEQWASAGATEYTVEIAPEFMEGGACPIPNFHVKVTLSDAEAADLPASGAPSRVVRRMRTAAEVKAQELAAVVAQERRAMASRPVDEAERRELAKAIWASGNHLTPTDAWLAADEFLAQPAPVVKS